MIIKKRWLLAVIFTVLHSGIIHADDDEFEAPLNEAFQSSLVFPQERGEVQWTFAPGFSSGTDVNSIGLPIAFEYGITDALQVELEWNETFSFDRLNQASSISEGQVGLGLQYSFMDIGASGFHMAIGGEVETIIHRGEFQRPSIGNAGYDDAESRTSFTPFAIFAVDIKQAGNLHLFAHTGVELSRSEQEAFFNFGGLLPFGDTVLSVEWNWSEEEQFITPGVTYKFDSGWEVGLGTAVGLTGGSDNYRVVLNVIYEY